MAIGDVRPVETGPVSDCYYVDTGMYDTPEYGSVYVLDSDRPAVVETGIGTNYERILAAIDEVGIDREDVEYLIPTHVHLDHAGGAGFLAEACPEATVLVHEAGVRHLVDPGRLVAGTRQAVGDQWQYYTEPDPVPEDRIRGLEDGDGIDLGDRELRAHAVPGHAHHQHVFHSPSDEAVFTADAAGIWVPSIREIHETSPPPEFDLESCIEDVETIRDLDPEVLLYSHFGPAETADLLDRYERRLTEWVEEVERVRERLDDDEAVVEHFAAETDMDEVWGEHKARGETAMNVRGVLDYLDS